MLLFEGRKTRLDGTGAGIAGIAPSSGQGKGTFTGRYGFITALDRPEAGHELSGVLSGLSI